MQYNLAMREREPNQAASANLQDIIDGLEMQNDESSSYFCLDTGEVYVLSDEVLRVAEGASGSDQLYGFEEEEVRVAQRVLDSDRYRELPNTHDVHEWRIMAAFCYSLDDRAVCASCIDALHRRGAFRNFRDVLSRHGLLNPWYAFRGEALRKIAIGWCEENEIPYRT